MSRTGRQFEIILKDAHLGWGEKGDSRAKNNRSQYEAYLPITAVNARSFNVKVTEVFETSSEDGYYKHNLLASGSQDRENQYAKNFQSEGNLRELGYWLKERRKAKPGDRVKIEFIGENALKLTHYTND